jgi:purine-binding chemotaxis protein CheW
MGLLPVKGYNVRTIDAAQVVMPERYTPELREQYRYVISLHGSDWGLAVDGVADSVILQPDDVRWRSQRGKRPWLAGTVVDRMCALLDVAQLVWMFENQDGKRAPPRG